MGGLVLAACVFAGGAVPTVGQTPGRNKRFYSPAEAGTAEVLHARLRFGPQAPLLEIHHDRADAGLARRLATAAMAFRPLIFGEERTLGNVPPDTVRLFLTRDEEDFEDATGGEIPDWGVGVAFPATATIVMRSEPRALTEQDPRQILIHELTHVYLGLFLGRASHAAPRWFHEGLASLAAREWGWRERFELTVTLAARRWIPLERLEEEFPSGGAAASLAYLESLAAVAYLRDLSGEEGLAVFLRNLRRHGDFDAAMRRTYGVTYGEFDARWREALRVRYGWAAAAASSWTYWSPAALLLVFLFALRRARFRRQLAALELLERESPPEEDEDQTGASGGEGWVADEAARGEAEPERDGRAATP